ncbi:MAG TPA: phosphocholine cytidylyltransferase family protein, partial [Kofleriaceae bacterium]|nr:phosphocholine cytidylyltransferase family protein [Kofleriaceae bacterium]
MAEVSAVILAAGRGTRLEPLTRNIPKCLAPVGGVPLIDRLIERISEAGIDRLVVVAGYLANVLTRHLEGSDLPLAADAEIVVNDRYADWGNFYSLLVAEAALAGQTFIKIDGDVLIDDQVLPRVLEAPGPAVIAVDRSVVLGDEEMKVRTDGAGHVIELSKSLAPEDAAGESIGIERIDAEA